jgi:hypothetical protein
MTSRGGRIVLWGFVIILVVLIYVVANTRVTVPTDAQASAAILALVTAGAVAIERILEGFWTLVGGSRLGNWWPLKPIGERLNAFVDDLNKPLDTFYKNAKARADQATEASESLQPWLASPRTYLVELQDHIKDLQQLEPGNPRARAIAAGASRAVVGLQKHYPGLEGAATNANKVLANVNKFVQTFEDNPARRLLSLLVGMVLGLIAAGLLGLDAVQAVYGGIPKGTWVKEIYSWLPGIGAAATGLAMGAGASPTHELIKTLKEAKERNKARSHVKDDGERNSGRGRQRLRPQP